MAKIVILGGGLAGISTAYHLEQKGFTDYALFEKETTIGGLCGSIEKDGFTFDYTGHLLHVSDPYFHQLIQDVIGFDQFNSIERRSYIYSQGCYTPYPFQMHLYGLPTSTIAACIQGFVERKKDSKKPKDFIEWVNKAFGSGFAKHFFLPYQRKIFAYNLRKITASWTGRFVPSTSLEAIIQGALHPKATAQVGYNAQFWYPKKGGILFWVKKLAEQLKQPINTSCQATKIDTEQRVVHFANGHVEPYSILINTLPLDQTLRMLHGTGNSYLAQAADKLRCNSVLNFNLGMNKADVSDKHWIYFPENEYPFYRMGFTSNFSAHMAPKGTSLLYGEIAYIKRSTAWKQQQLNTARAKAIELLGIRRSDICMEQILDISHAYVIYDHWREKQLKKLLNRLAQQQIHSIGRYGAWKYCSMQETLLDGKQIVDALLVQPARRIETKKSIPKSTQKELSL